jgi:hypothetical protein
MPEELAVDAGEHPVIETTSTTQPKNLQILFILTTVSCNVMLFMSITLTSAILFIRGV